MYYVVKRYGHEEGWSVAFRQWQAGKSHCRFIHGYPLAFEFTYEAEHLDYRGWVIDFGGLKPLKAWLQDQFDHKMLVAEDDPEIEIFLKLGDRGIADIRFVQAVGCEEFAQMAWCYGNALLMQSEDWPRVKLTSVKVSEHGGNHAIFTVP